MMMVPGSKRAIVGESNAECIVSHRAAPRIIDEELDIEVDTSDCTIFTVSHLSVVYQDFLPSQENLLSALDDSLLAISEVLIWEKAHDVVRKISPYARQVGRVDVKYFFVEGDGRAMAMWRNPAYWASDSARGMLSGFLSNMLVTNGPAENPLSADHKRLFAALDLLNLGFFTESFITLFSLADDLVQRVVSKGLEDRGLNDDEQRALLRAIAERRLHHYLTSVIKVCGWESYEESQPADFRALMKANTLRNEIMHGDKRIFRQDVYASMQAIYELFNWLGANPFDCPIPAAPPGVGGFVATPRIQVIGEKSISEEE